MTAARTVELIGLERLPIGASLLAVASLATWSGVPSALSGQEPEEPCTWAACALRVEAGGFFSGRSIVRGAHGEEVAGLDPSEELESLFQSNDSAAHWYGDFAEADGVADWMERGGLALTISGVLLEIVADDDDDGLQLTGVVLNVAGSVVGILAGRPRRRASRAISRAIWWHNRELIR